MVVSLAISFVSMLCIFSVPFLNTYGSLTGLDGTPGFIDHPEMWSGADPLTAITYGMGDIFCHQQEERSFTLNGSQMPFCVRDVGLLAGFFLCNMFIVLFYGSEAISRNARIFIIVSFLLIFMDWLIQQISGLNIPVTRFVTGLLAGAGFSLILYSWTNRAMFGEEGVGQGRKP